LTGLIQAHQPNHVIVKGYLEIESPPQDVTRAQVASARANGCSVGMYVWCYRSASPYTTIDDIVALCASVELALPLLWLDCETYENTDPGPDADWLAKAVEYAETKYQMACGIYTGLWWIQGHFPGGEAEFANFARLPQWWSVYDNVADIDRFIRGAGVVELAAKQYTATPVDLSVIRDEYTVYQGTVEPKPEPDTTKDEVIEGLRIALDDVGYNLLGQDIATLETVLTSLKARHAEMRRIREQFLGRA
jgi:hypothetical protein